METQPPRENQLTPFEALGHTFQLRSGIDFGAWPYFARDGVHEVLCGAVECCWQTFPVAMIHSLEEHTDISLYNEITIQFRSENQQVHIRDLDRSVTLSLADYRAFLLAFVPAALPLSRFGPERFRQEIPERLRAPFQARAKFPGA